MGPIFLGLGFFGMGSLEHEYQEVSNTEAIYSLTLSLQVYGYDERTGA